MSSMSSLTERKFLRHVFVERDDLVEEGCYLAIDAVGFFGQANTEVATTKRAKRADELAAIDKLTLGLDVHVTLRSALLPPPRLIIRSPPAARSVH
jgi:hypothetical protein